MDIGLTGGRIQTYFKSIESQFIASNSLWWCVFPIVKLFIFQQSISSYGGHNEKNIRITGDHGK